MFVNMNICAVINVNQLRKQDTQCSALVTRLFTEEFRCSAEQTFERYCSLTSHFFYNCCDGARLWRRAKQMSRVRGNAFFAWRTMGIPRKCEVSGSQGLRRLSLGILRRVVWYILTDVSEALECMAEHVSRQSSLSFLSYGLNQTTVFQTTLHELHHYFP